MDGRGKKVVRVSSWVLDVREDIRITVSLVREIEPVFDVIGTDSLPMTKRVTFGDVRYLEEDFRALVGLF